MLMKLLIRTTNTVLIDYATALLRDRGLAPVVLDQHMSILEGSVGALPRRLMIEEGDEPAARRALEEAGLAHELEREGRGQ
jgi:hypothetical protein